MANKRSKFLVSDFYVYTFGSYSSTTCNVWLCVYSRASPCMRCVSGIVPRRWVLSMHTCRWLIYVERSHSQLVTASVLGQLRATLRMSTIIWRFCFSLEVYIVIIRSPTMHPQRHHHDCCCHISWIGNVSFHNISTLAIIILKNFYKRSQGWWGAKPNDYNYSTRTSGC